MKLPHLRRILTVLSLLLLTCALALYLRGRSTSDALWLTSTRWQSGAILRRQWLLVTGEGRLVLRYQILDRRFDDAWEAAQWHALHPDGRVLRHQTWRTRPHSAHPLAEGWGNRLGFGKRARELEDGNPEVTRWREWSVMTPTWLLILLTSILPARRAARIWRSWRRQRSGRCVQCGYDLRASTQTCPECGREVR